MKAKFSLLLILITVNIAFSQNRVITYYANGKTKEIFHTKTKNDTIKNGDYLMYFPDLEVKETGNYKNGVREGIWKTCITNGEYRDIVIYKDYNTGLTYKKHEYDLINWYSPKYPKKAKEEGHEGVVLLEVLTDSCRIKNYKVVKSAGYGFDESALEAFGKYLNLRNRDFEKIMIDTCTPSKTIMEYRFRQL